MCSYMTKWRMTPRTMWFDQGFSVQNRDEMFNKMYRATVNVLRQIENDH